MPEAYNPIIRLFSGETNCKQCLVVRPGNLNIILALPHGGGFKPNSYLNRTYGCYSSNGTTCEYNHDCNPDPENCTDR